MKRQRKKKECDNLDIYKMKAVYIERERLATFVLG